MEYTVVIRSLGKAGDMYQRELDSLMKQTIKPSAIFIYLAEGYDIPKETVGFEHYITVKKGMVAQRALPYDEVKTDYILFLDDDVFIPENGVEKLYDEMTEHNADVISPCLFPSHEASLKNKIRLSLFGKEFCRFWRSRWAFKILRTTGISYCNNPGRGVYESQANGGPCFFCTKDVFLDTKFEDELWLDQVPYAFPEDHVMFYKMYLRGHKVLTTYDSDIVHLDAGTTLGVKNSDRINRLIYSEYRNRMVLWHRFIYSCQKNMILKAWSCICITYYLMIQFCKIIAKIICGDRGAAKALRTGISDGIAYVRSEEYKLIPKVLE